jgi:DNA-binding response OmpR family regulator
MAERKKILVVDDDEALRAIIARILSLDFEVSQAANGLVAAEMLTDGLLPDLIVLDVMMAKLDGFGFAEWMKGDAKWRSIPIIFLSARAEPADVIRGINAGARHYITKPFSPEELRAKVGKVLK